MIYNFYTNLYFRSKDAFGNSICGWNYRKIINDSDLSNLFKKDIINSSLWTALKNIKRYIPQKGFNALIRFFCIYLINEVNIDPVLCNPETITEYITDVHTCQHYNESGIFAHVFQIRKNMMDFLHEDTISENFKRYLINIPNRVCSLNIQDYENNMICMNTENITENNLMGTIEWK
jgi:hypothetical protein